LAGVLAPGIRRGERGVEHRAGRAAWSLLALGLLALSLLEIKLAHLFCAAYPLLLVLGGGWWISRLAPLLGVRRRALEVAAAALILGVFSTHADVLAPAGAVAQRALDLRPRQELVAALRELARRAPPAEGRVAALGMWELGAHLMYYGGVPVVASGYHRNLDGIRDSFRALTGSTEAAMAVLRQRRVRWLVWQGDPMFLFQANAAFPELPRLGRIESKRIGGELATGFIYEPAAFETLWGQLLEQPQPAGRGLRLAYESSSRRSYPGGFTAPAFRVYEVLAPP
jgi:hypothetical protein